MDPTKPAHRSTPKLVGEAQAPDHQVQKGRVKSIFLVLTVTFASIVNVCPFFFFFMMVTPTKRCLLIFHSGCKRYYICNSFASNPKRDAGSGSSAPMDCLCVSSQFREFVISGVRHRAGIPGSSFRCGYADSP